MNLPTNTPIFFRNSLRISSFIFLVIAAFAIPKIAGAAGTLNHIVPIVPRYSIHVAKNSLNRNNLNPQNSLNEYEPPDFGRPASSYGSGTR